MTRPAFWQCVSYSPILTRYGRGVYGLAGADVPPGVVESLTPRRRWTRVLQDYGWTSDQQLWLGYQLSDGMLASGVLSVPTAMREAALGEYALTTTEGARFGSLVIREHGAWGLAPFDSRRGGEVGDYLVIVRPWRLSNRENGGGYPWLMPVNILTALSLTASTPLPSG